MAIRSEPDIFMREVDEELRKDRVNRIFTRYGWAIIAGVLLLLAAIGGAIWWQNRQQVVAAEQGEALLSALESIEGGNAKGAAPTIATLADSNREGYRAAALFVRAGTEADAGNVAAAAATLGAIAADEDFAAPYREAALVRQTALEFDRLQPQVVIDRLGALAKPGQPWFGSAGEMVGIAHLKMGRANLAGPLFAQIGRDQTVPTTIRTRAIQMAGSLGVNAMPEGDAGAAQEQKAAPAATREKAE